MKNTMSWIDFDQVSVTTQGIWYHTDRVPGRLFRVVRDDDKGFKSLGKLVIRRWNFDESGDRYYFGRSQTAWFPPGRQVVELGIDDPELEENAGVALYLSRRYEVFGDFTISVWDTPQDMRYQFVFNTGDLDDSGVVLIPHNLGTIAPAYNLLDATKRSIQPNGVRFLDENVIELDVSGYRGFTGNWVFHVERRG